MIRIRKDVPALDTDENDAAKAPKRRKSASESQGNGGFKSSKVVVDSSREGEDAVVNPTARITIASRLTDLVSSRLPKTKDDEDDVQQ